MQERFTTSFAPVRVGEEVDVKIEAVGEKGDGIARVKGFVLFVPGVKEGDEVKIKITKVLSKVGFAEVVGEGTVPEGGAPEQASDQPAEGTQEQEAPEEPQPEDTEDFGEELEEEKKE